MLLEEVKKKFYHVFIIIYATKFNVWKFSKNSRKMNLNMFLWNTRDLLYIMWKPVEKADNDKKDTKTNDTKN